MLFSSIVRHPTSSFARARGCALSTSVSLSTSAPRGEGSLAVVMGGFGFSDRQLKRHVDLYEQYGFGVMPVLSTIPQLVSPAVAWRRGPELAARIEERDAPVVIHTVSGAFWTAMFVLAHLSPEWRERNVRAIMFDSNPKPRRVCVTTLTVATRIATAA